MTLLERVKQRVGLLQALGAGARTLYQGVKDTPRDIKRMRVAHKLLTRTRPIDPNLPGKLPPLLQRHQTLTAALSQGKNAFSPEDFARKSTEFAKVEKTRAKLGAIRKAAVQRNAIRLGALGLGLTAGSFAYRTYKLRKRQAQERAKYRDYHVFPEHNYATAPVQPENRAVYYDNPVPSSGPPRVIENERTQLINQIIEAILG